VTTNPDYADYKKLFPYIQQYQALASKYNIADIFQDNGGKYVQLLILLGLKTSGKREGNDAYDKKGKEFEIKTVNINLTRPFSTHHHLNPVILKKYRKVDWYFAVYRSIQLDVIYKLTPKQLKPFFKTWETKWHTNQKDINNPKIPVKFVVDNGTIVWLPEGVSGYVLPQKPKMPKAVKAKMPLTKLKKKTPRKRTLKEQGILPFNK
jgi:hypothetical protein